MAENKKITSSELALLFGEFENDVIAEDVIPTGFAELDKALEGGFPEVGLHVIGAVSSLGKTTFAMQMAENIAEVTPVLVFSLEMSQKDLIAKSVSRQTYLLSSDERQAKFYSSLIRKKTRSNFTDTEKELVKKASIQASKKLENISIRVSACTVDDVDKVVNTYIEKIGKKPFVIIDYLQKLRVPDNKDTTDKRKVDYIVDRLTEIRDKYKISILAVTSFNRENYTQEASFKAFKDSGSIEYSADTVLALQMKGVGTDGYDEAVAKAKMPRDVELKVLKQRMGAVGTKIDLKFDSRFNYFRELSLEEGFIPVSDGDNLPFENNDDFSKMSGFKTVYNPSKQKGGKHWK